MMEVHGCAWEAKQRHTPWQKPFKELHQNLLFPAELQQSELASWPNFFQDLSGIMMDQLRWATRNPNVFISTSEVLITAFATAQKDQEMIRRWWWWWWILFPNSLKIINSSVIEGWKKDGSFQPWLLQTSSSKTVITRPHHHHHHHHHYCQRSNNNHEKWHMRKQEDVSFIHSSRQKHIPSKSSSLPAAAIQILALISQQLDGHNRKKKSLLKVSSTSISSPSPSSSQQQQPTSCRSKTNNYRKQNLDKTKSATTTTTTTTRSKG